MVLDRNQIVALLFLFTANCKPAHQDSHTESTDVSVRDHDYAYQRLSVQTVKNKLYVSCKQSSNEAPYGKIAWACFEKKFNHDWDIRAKWSTEKNKALKAENARICLDSFYQAIKNKAPTIYVGKVDNNRDPKPVATGVPNESSCDFLDMNNRACHIITFNFYGSAEPKTDPCLDPEDLPPLPY